MLYNRLKRSRTPTDRARRRSNKYSTKKLQEKIWPKIGFRTFCPRTHGDRCRNRDIRGVDTQIESLTQYHIYVACWPRGKAPARARR